MQSEKQNLIYLYDLPKKEVDSKKIAIVFKKQADVDLKQRPQIRKDITRPFWSAIINIQDDQKFKDACEKMMYFEIDGKQCRGLKFDRQLLGTNREKLTGQNVFVRDIPTTVTSAQLHEKFEKFGPVKSLKISLNEDHTSRGYGFVCFDSEEVATKAISETEKGKECIAVKFQPKDRRNMRRLINNVYVKNIPLTMTDTEVRKLFAEHGHIQSLVLFKNEYGQYGFVCYNDPQGTNAEYGPQCAQTAIDKLHGKKMSSDPEVQLYVRHALKKSEREAEKMKETLRYKSSKKRCNLYVKNFPANWTDAELSKLFGEFGEVENIKFQQGERSGNFAFVCFKQPDHAAMAKQTLHNSVYDGKTLIINHYEIKELREIQIQDTIDKADFEKYQLQQNSSFQMNDLTSMPNISQILQQLLDIMQQNHQMAGAFNNQERHRGGQNAGGRRTNYNNNYGGPRNQGQNPRPAPGGPPMPIQGGMPAPMNNMPPMPAPQQPQPMGMPPAAAQGPPAPQMNQGGVPPQQMMMQQHQVKYMQDASRLLPAVSDKNKHLKNQVGQLIFPYIQTMLGPNAQARVPKITGMLIELPLDQIKMYMMSFENLAAKVTEANTLIDQAERK